MTTTLVVLALIRVVLCAIALPFAVRGRYPLLCGVLVLGALAALAVAGGLPRVVASAVATPVYGLLALHALDITRRRRPKRPAPPK